MIYKYLYIELFIILYINTPFFLFLTICTYNICTYWNSFLFKNYILFFLHLLKTRYCLYISTYRESEIRFGKNCDKKNEYLNLELSKKKII